MAVLYGLVSKFIRETLQMVEPFRKYRDSVGKQKSCSGRRHAINTGYNPNYLKWSVLESRCPTDVVHKLFTEVVAVCLGTM